MNHLTLLDGPPDPILNTYYLNHPATHVSTNGSEVKSDDDDPPEMQDQNMQPLPEENIANYPQEKGTYFRNKLYVRTDKLPLKRFMVLANDDYHCLSRILLDL